MFFRFSPGISLNAKGCPRSKWPKTPVFRDFPSQGVQSAKTENVKKLRYFGEKLFGAARFPPQKVPLALGTCPRPKRAKIPLDNRFRPLGVRPKKKSFPRKLWEIIPDSVVTFFFRFGDPCSSGAQKGPCGACCCLLAAAAC